MIKVGLTGNIGSGKSLVARIFETLHIPVFYADIEAKKILDNPDVREEVVNLFGQDVIEGTRLLRPKIAEIVFSDKQALEKLNQIIHPAVRKQFTIWANHQISPYVIYEAAILHESGHYKNMDKIILVKADENLRIKRVVKRDQVSEEQVKSRMQNQWPESKKEEFSDFVIDNNEKDLLIPQVLSVHEEIKSAVR
jgi:dephospho-CoA kinase